MLYRNKKPFCYRVFDKKVIGKIMRGHEIVWPTGDSFMPGAWNNMAGWVNEHGWYK